MIYFLVLFFTLIILFFINNVFYRNRFVNILISACCLLLLLITHGMRSIYSTPDTLNYLEMIKYPYSHERVEYLYLIYSNFLSDFNFSDQLYVFILYFIPVFFIYLVVIRKFSGAAAFIMLFIALSFSYFDLSTNLLRQFYGTVIWLTAVIFTFRGTRGYHILLIATVLFHTSFIVPVLLTYIALYFRRMDFGTNRILFGLVLFLTALGVLTIFKVPIGQNIFSLLDYVPSSIAELQTLISLIKTYFKSGITFGSLFEIELAGRINEIVSLLAPIYLFFFIKDKDDEMKFYFLLYYLSALLYLIMASQALSYRYSYFAFSLLPLYFVVLTKNNRYLYTLVGTSLLLLMNLYIFIRIQKLNYELYWL